MKISNNKKFALTKSQLPSKNISKESSFMRNDRGEA